MIVRSDLTDSEYVFLNSQKILPSQLFDARGRTSTSWGDAAKEQGYLFGLNEPCGAGHRLRTRAGHCIQCDTARIAYIRRFASKGFVYIAASPAGRIFKVGSSVDLERRTVKLNFDSYAGQSDWVMLCGHVVPSMGQVEYKIHKSLERYVVPIEYVKDGNKQMSREVFRAELKVIWQSFLAQTKAYNEGSRWRHPSFEKFDFT